MKLTLLALCFSLVVFAGCGKSSSGVLSHSDFAYAADTPEKIAQVRTRFDTAVQVLQSAGLREVSMERSSNRSEAILRAAETEARLALYLPENGLVTISLEYKFEGAASEAKAKAESTLARAKEILAPNQASPR